MKRPYLLAIALVCLFGSQACIGTSKKVFRRTIQEQDQKIDTVQSGIESDERRIKEVDDHVRQEVGRLDSRLDQAEELLDGMLAKKKIQDSGRDYLTQGMSETKGYGLYSYILFGERPGKETKERQLAAISGFLRRPLITELERYPEPDQSTRLNLNITYLPVLSMPSEKSGAEDVLANYDYGRARSLIVRAKLKNRSGIYLILSTSPLADSPPGSEFICWDLSTKHAQLISAYIEEYFFRMSHTRFWGVDELAFAFLTLRNYLGILGESIEGAALHKELVEIFKGKI